MHRRSVACALSLLSLLTPCAASADDTVAECEAASIRAQRHRNDHALVAAKKDLLLCAAATCPGVIRRDCDRWLGEVDAILPTIVPAAQDAQGRDLVDVQVELDNVSVSTRIDGAAVPLDPGSHVVRFRRNGIVVDQRIVVREGERARPVVAKFPGPEEKPAPPPPPPPPPREPPNILTIGTYAFAGLAVVGLGVGTIETIRGVSEYRDLRDSCGRTRSCAPSDVESARRDILIADVSFGVGIVCAAAATVLYLVKSEWSRER